MKLQHEHVTSTMKTLLTWTRIHKTTINCTTYAINTCTCDYIHNSAGPTSFTGIEDHFKKKVTTYKCRTRDVMRDRDVILYLNRSNCRQTSNNKFLFKTNNIPYCSTVFSTSLAVSTHTLSHIRNSHN